MKMAILRIGGFLYVGRNGVKKLLIFSFEVNITLVANLHPKDMITIL